MSETIQTPLAHNALWDSFSDRAYRHAYTSAYVGDFLAMQLHSMRIREGLTQSDAAKRAITSQSQVSALESSCENASLASLRKFAALYDVALVVKFVPFSELARLSLTGDADRAVPGFDDESALAIGFSSGGFALAQPAPVERRPSARQAYVRYDRPITNAAYRSSASVG